MHKNSSPTKAQQRLLWVALMVALILPMLISVSLRWLDAKPWLSYPDERIMISFVRHVYLLNPFSTMDEDIVRTIKVAHFISIVDINKKPLETLLTDMNSAQLLIANFINETSGLNDNARVALVLKRLITLNRINAIALRGGMQQLTDLSELVIHVQAILPALDDDSIKRSLVKESVMYDIGKQEELIAKAKRRGDLSAYVDIYHLGLGRCASRDESGAALISSALEGIPSDKLIEITIRNVDHPLIATAALPDGSLCSQAIQWVYKSLGAKT